MGMEDMPSPRAEQQDGPSLLEKAWRGGGVRAPWLDARRLTSAAYSLTQQWAPRSRWAPRQFPLGLLRCQV